MTDTTNQIVENNVETTEKPKRTVKGKTPSIATQLIITQVLEIMNKQEITPRMLCWDIDIDEGQFSKWVKYKANFSIDKIQSILDYLGYELVIAPKA